MKENEMPRPDNNQDTYERYILRAERCLEDYEIDDAMVYARKHLKLYPKDFRAMTVMMEACYESGEFDDALAYCDKLLEVEKLDSKLYARKASLISSKDIDGAVDLYDQAIALDPNCYEIICAKGKLLSDCIDCEEEALETLKKAIEVAPDKAEAYMETAFVYNHLDKKDLASKFAAKAYEIEPDNEFYKMHCSIMKMMAGCKI